jgi:hypothetical protein
MICRLSTMKNLKLCQLVIFPPRVGEDEEWIKSGRESSNGRYYS